MSMMETHFLKYLQIFFPWVKPGNGRRSKIFQRCKMYFFLHNASFISLSIRSEKEHSVMTYMIQKCFLWRGQGFSLPSFRTAWKHEVVLGLET